MALETGPDSPVPVAAVSEMLSDWIGRLGAIWVEGEISDFRPRPQARVQFFALRDLEENSSLSIMAPTDLVGQMDPPLEVGQRVIVWGRPEFYKVQGRLQLRARTIRAVGIGELLARLAQLQATLAAEGLFAPERKKPLPFLPSRIGLICGRNSDAKHDVLVNARDRWPAADFEIREVAVQGANAVREVTDALHELDAMPDVDVIVITRGGGSVEDLLPFSNESLVRAVAAATTPIVSAIGHEQDNPIMDYAADHRASTPTDAGKRVVPSFIEQDQLVRGLLERGRGAVVRGIERESTWIADVRQRIHRGLSVQVQALERDVEHLIARTRSLSPAATLERGYAVVQNSDGSVIRDADTVRAEDQIRITVMNGVIGATVQETERRL